MMAVSIRSGGQTGVDRAALDFAVRHGLPYAGWCPHGGWAEDYPQPPGLLAVYPHLTETPSAAPEQRTAWNVRDSHATMILSRGDEWRRSPGTVFARQCAELIFLRPCYIADMDKPGAADRAREWLSPLAAALGVDRLMLHVAGPRESESRGICAAVESFLADLVVDRSR